MAQNYTETIFELPEEIIKASPGFSYDIGGSIAKVVYRCKDDYDNGVRKNPQGDGKMGQIRMQTLPAHQIDDVIKILKERCDLLPSSEEKPVYTTGTGGNLFLRKVEKELGVKLNNVGEFDCFIEVFCYAAKHLSRDQIFLPELKTVKEAVEKYLKVFETFTKATPDDPNARVKFTAFHHPDDLKVEETSDDAEPILPCIVALCGSGVACMKIDENGEAFLIDVIPIAGRMFQGLSALLTGVKKFSELEKLAIEGTGETVNILFKDLRDPKAAADMYSQMPGDEPLLLFAKAVTNHRESLKDDDMVHTLLRAFSMNIAQIMQLHAKVNDIRNIYYCGNFSQIEMVQEFISMSMGQRNMAEPPEKKYRTKFIKNGGFLGAIGAFMEADRQQRKQHEETEQK